LIVIKNQSHFDKDEALNNKTKVTSAISCYIYLSSAPYFTPTNTAAAARAAARHGLGPHHVQKRRRARVAALQFGHFHGVYCRKLVVVARVSVKQRQVVCLLMT
jgi:hypothetical protein